MVVHTSVEDSQDISTCFLCALDPDPHPCAVPRLEGYVIAAHVANLDGEAVPWVTIKVGEAYASVTLNRYYREMVKGLRALSGSLEEYQLLLRIYHLPPPMNTTIHHGRNVDRYRANSYTLAVLEPETIMNITDLNQAEYCARQYLLG